MFVLLKLFAPYVALGFFWFGTQNAWLTILAYHAQIVIWFCISRPNLAFAWDRRSFFVAALPCILAGPVAYFLLPIVAEPGSLEEWLSTYGLTGLSLVIMIPYFGLVHPFLEQVHWQPLRRNGMHVHVLFALYHGLVLYSLLDPAWLGFCLFILGAASVLWGTVSRRTGSLLAAVMGHSLADLGIVLAAWFRMNT